jgi:hypothetical protein
MTKPKYLRHKKAKGRDYWYFDAGKRPDGKRDLIALPHIKDPVVRRRAGAGSGHADQPQEPARHPDARRADPAL